MNQDPSEMYKFLETLNIGKTQENSFKNEIRFNAKDTQINSPSSQRSKKCDDKCIDCFLIFCRK